MARLVNAVKPDDLSLMSRTRMVKEDQRLQAALSDSHTWAVGGVRASMPVCTHAN